MAGAGIEAEQIGAADLYSCFPIAVWVAMDALGMSLDDPRPLTLTGGLPFLAAGEQLLDLWDRRDGALVASAVCAVVRHCRRQWRLSFPHAVGIYANIPAEFPEAVPEFKAPEVVEVVSDPEPDGVIESYTFPATERHGKGGCCGPTGV